MTGTNRLAQKIALVAGMAAAMVVALPAAAELPDAGGLLAESIAVHGGRAALESLPDLSLEGSYESGRWGGGQSWDIQRYERADGAYRTEVVFEFRGSRRTVVEMYDGASLHKRRFGTGWDDLPLDEPEEWRDHRLSFLVAAAERDPETVGEAEVAGVAVWQVSVSDGRGRALLSLARDDGRLVALEYPATEAGGMGTKTEVTRTILMSDFREVGGVLLAHDLEVRKDGSMEYHLRYDEVEVLDEFDPAWVLVPDPSRRFIPSEELAF